MDELHEKVINDVVKEAKALFDADKEAWGEVYREGLEDLKFLSDSPTAQWSDGDYNSRVKSGRPALTLDKLGQFTRQVVNQIRMNTPTINVIPSDGASNKETADVIKGLIKNIEYVSNADDAYDTAVLSSVRCGLGFIRVDHDYADSESFDQDLKIERVVNTLSCWIDSNSTQPDGSDAMHGFVIDKIKIAEFKKRYPKYDPVSFDTGKSEEGDQKEGVYVTIAEFFKIHEEDRDIAVYDGEVMDFDENREEPEQRRTVKKRTVKRYKISGADILEETTFPGKYIPIVPVYGEEFWMDGKRSLFSLIRKSKTAQQLHNYWKSLETELLMKQPQAPIMAAEGQTEEYSEDWLNPGKSMVLRYKQTDLEGKPAPMPQRVNPPVTPTGVFQASLSTVDDIKASMGMYGSSIGQQTNETSGIAIQRRKQEGEVGTYHFADNLVKSIMHVGKILVCAMPEVYDTSRVLRIIGDEDETEMVGVNGESIEGQEDQHNLTQGKYDVRVTTGASFTTMRQESADFMTQIVQSQPELMGIAGDLVFKNMDIPGAEALSNRIKKTIPPELLDEDDQEQDPEKVQMMNKLQEAAANIQIMQQEVQKMDDQLKSKDGEMSIKAQSEQDKAEHDRMKIELEYLKLQLDEKKSDFDGQVKEQELELKARELELKELEIKSNIEIDLLKEIPETESLDNSVNVYGEADYE